MFGQSFISELVEPASRHILLELRVPQLGVELKQPPPEGSELIAVHAADSLFGFLDLLIVTSLPPEDRTMAEPPNGLRVQRRAQKTLPSAASIQSSWRVR